MGEPAEEPTVEMRPAWQWTCEACGRDSFERTVVCDPRRDKDFAEMLQEAQAQDAGFDGVQWYTCPRWVQCGHCGARYATHDMRQQGEAFDGEEGV